MHVLIDSEGHSYNVELKIKNNKLIVIWNREEIELDLKKCYITIDEEMEN